MHCAVCRAQIGTAHTDAAQGLRPRIIALEQIKGNAGNFYTYIGGGVQFSTARKAGQFIVPHINLHYIALAAEVAHTHGNAFGEQHQHQPYILICGQIARRGGAVTNALDGGMRILFGNRGLIQPPRKCRERIAHHTKPAFERFGICLGKLPNSANTIAA